MRIERVEVKNFRLLKQAAVLLEEQTTVVVGRNNSGKTSLTELFRRLLKDTTPQFRLEDFALPVHADFWTAAQKLSDGEKLDDVRKTLPCIEVRMTFRYSAAEELGPLTPFVVDLDEACSEALVVVRFEPRDGTLTDLLAKEGATDAPIEVQQDRFYRALQDRIGKSYGCSVHAEDPNDPTNRKELDLGHLRAIVRGDIITAQRGLDDITARDRDVLGKILQDLFDSASADGADKAGKDLIDGLTKAVDGIQETLRSQVKTHLQGLLPHFEVFNYPGFHNPNLTTETGFDVARLLQNHTKVRYPGAHGLTLPETYNGLGARNLIYILLHLYSFFKQFQVAPAAPAVHLVFIEEPEAHLHPQMQEVFVRQLGVIAKKFAELNGGGPWPVQFLISTHSSHIANSAPINALRYFLAGAEAPASPWRAARIKDLRAGLSGKAADDLKFLQQYLTLTRCDLFFADKAILIEGTCERLLLPVMMRLVDAEDATAPQLASQYFTVLEVGGAYAHLFDDLLAFLELPALVITDIDAVDGNGEACPVAGGEKSSNACIKAWFDGKSSKPSDLVAYAEADRVKGIKRLAYQIPEGDGEPCARSLEDAVMLANKTAYGLQNVPVADLGQRAADLAKKQKKTEFALKLALGGPKWNVPRYIAEGLRWLARTNAPESPAPPAAAAAAMPAAAGAGA
ncbi:ATP-dependent nuclease [Tahibacter soli]|uniref:ATP-dependent endonuclease n=1 Tax=Tahibacter soli TaxID=2983605 RepID=A0A9X3YFM8_9GAMM|nr:ATP-dependent endonuclease [Tahibacter soli]MDC8010972.1 ATP-dependent endonuclease [Tahibacter soli]